jgi:glycosyltransferase involved in cell wall biosynthesis
MSNAYTKKVLFVIDGMNVGGTQEHIYNFVLQFPEYHVTIISLYGENFYKSRLDALSNVQVVHICKALGTNRKHLVLYAPYVVFKFLKIREQLIGKYDFVDLRLPFALLLWTLARLNKVTPCYYSVDSDVRQLTWYEKLVFKLCLPSIPRVGLVEQLRSGYSYIKFGDSQLLPGGIFVTQRHSTSPREYEYEKNLLFIARLVPYKDPLAAIRLVEIINIISPVRVGLHIIGDGPLKRDLEEYCSAARLDFVEFYGYIAGIEDFIPNADGLLKTSLGEPVNSVVREMLLSGKKVFSTVELEADRKYVEAGIIHEVFREDLEYSARSIVDDLVHGAVSNAADSRVQEHFGNSDAVEYFKQLVESNNETA